MIQGEIFAMGQVLVKANDRSLQKVHPWPIRLMHWINALAMLVMIGSGWKIYEDEVLFGWLHFPDSITLGGSPEGALQWHFLGMWVLAVNGLVYLVYGLVTGRFRHKLLPIRFDELAANIRDAVQLRLKHNDIADYNMVQRLLYLGIILIGIVQVLSGLAIWKPVQFSELAALFGSFQTARLIHFLCMAAIALFLFVHVTLALLVPRALLSMLTGGPIVNASADDGSVVIPAEQAR